MGEKKCAHCGIGEGFVKWYGTKYNHPVNAYLCYCCYSILARLLDPENERKEAPFDNPEQRKRAGKKPYRYSPPPQWTHDFVNRRT